MNYCKKYISIFLLLVFTWVVLPPAIVHELLADHQDTECLGHPHDLKQVESLHKHCDIFKTIAPLYDVPELTIFEKPIQILISEVKEKTEQFYFDPTSFTLNSRGPPVSYLIY